MRLTRLLLISSLLVSSVCLADDKSKATRDLRRISALASDGTARRILNAQIAHDFNLEPAAIITERKTLSLSYGDEFLLHHLLSHGATASALAEQLRSGQRLPDIAEAQHADWKAVQNATAHFLSEMNKSIYEFFVTEHKPVPGEYNPAADWIKLDATAFTSDDLGWAVNTYLSNRERALRNSGRRSGLDELEYNSFHFRDHLKENAPPPPPLPNVPQGPH